MLKYSGDTDGAVPTWGTKQWINDLNWAIKEEWRPWYVPDDEAGDQIGGYVTEYDGLTFSTIHGVGHMAPEWKRASSLLLIEHFIKDLSLPK